LSKPSSYLCKNIDKTIKYQPIWRKTMQEVDILPKKKHNDKI
jgi:hypothetical protein